MFIAALFIIDKTWKQSGSTDGRMDKETVAFIYLYKVNIISQKKNSHHLWQHKWTLRELRLSQKNQSKKFKYCMV